MKVKIADEPNGLAAFEVQKPKEEKGASDDGSYLDVLRHSDYKDWLALIVGLSFNILNGALIPFDSFVFEGITDVLMNGEAQYQNGTLNMPDFKTGIFHYCSMYLLLGSGLFICSYLANASMFFLCERRLHCIRKMYLKSVLKQDASWFDYQQTGSLTQKMSSGIEKIKDGLGDKAGLIFSSMATFFSGIAVGFYMCWQMTLLMLITVPLDIGSMYISGKLMTKTTKKEMGSYSQAGAIANEVIAGIRTVMSFNAQSFEIKRYEKQLNEAQQLGIRKARILSMASTFPHFLMFMIMGLAFWYGSTLVAAGAVNPGAIFGVFWAVLMSTRRLGEVVPHLGALTSARFAAKDIFKIIDHKPTIDCTKKSGLKPGRINGKISFENIHFTYPTRPDVKILKGVSFEVNPGETIALVGHSGCGKSTSIGLLMRFYDQEKGVIKLDNVPLDQYNIEWLRSTIGIVQQEPIIFVATVAENIRMGDMNITDSDIEEACKMANAHEFIRDLSDAYETVIGAGAVQLSGGQKQRIAIARAIVRKPRLLLLDEATSALDTESEQMVQAALDKASEGRTTLCIAHRLSTVRNASKILVFDQGLIVEQGRHEELMEKENGVYKSMVKAQEIEKSREDTTLDDVEVEEIHRSIKKETIQGDDQKIEQDSARLRQSMISTTSQMPDWEIESAREDMIEEGAMEASLLDIFKYAKPERRSLIIAMFLTFIRGFTWPLFSVVYGILFKILSAGGEDMVHKSVINSVWFILIGVMSSITTILAGGLLGKAGETMSGRLRMDVFKNLMQQDCTYFDNPKHGVGALTARLATDAPNVQAAIDQRLAEVLAGVTSLFCGVAIAFYFGWNMAPIGLLTAAILVVSQTAVAQYLKFRGQKDLDSAVEASRIVTEAISNWKTVQSLTKQEYMYQAFINASKVPHRRNIVRGLWQALSYAAAGSFIAWNFAIAYSFGYWLVSNGWSTPFTIFQVIEALNMAAFSVMMAASYFPEYVRARISAGVMFTMIRQKSSIDNRGMLGEKPTIDGNIKMKGVYFAYPNRKRHLVMNGFNMSAKFGETVALVGPSGCGKSTTIQLVERFYDALCGQVMVDNRDIRDLSVKHVRESIALVGQEPTLFNLSIGENIAYGLENPSQEEIEKAAKLANIHNFVISLPEGYDTSVGQSGGRLSGGQKQRIAIARAVIRNPRILLLDEATSALDTESEKIVQEALDKARLGRTCIVIAHRLSTIQNADKIIVVKAGKNIEEGSHQTLLARKGLYYRLVEKQSG